MSAMEKFEPINALNQVAEFHQAFHHPVLPEPEIPSEKRCRLRVALLSEELDELKDALDKKDMVQVADALCDIQYVLSGAVLEFGLGTRFRALFDEVQRSNMSKACLSEEDAIKTVEYYKNKDNTECYYKKIESYYLVYRKSDNKTMKSVNYSPADIEGILKQ